MFKSSLEFFRGSQGLIESKNVYSKIYSGLLSTLVMRRQNRLRAIEKNIKEEFFRNYNFNDNGNTNLKIIPRKTWNRYSAFLTCQQLVHSRSISNKQVFDRQSPPNTKELTSVERRISIQIKSIKSLPIWATALNELSLIENDISTLGFMDCYDIANIVAMAA